MERDDLGEALERLHVDSYGWALGCCMYERDEASEVLQSSYLKVLDGRARYDGRASFKTWLFAVIRRTAAERRRKRLLLGRTVLRLFSSRTVPAQPQAPDVAASGAERSDRLLEALQRVALRQREVLWLVFYHDMSIADAATALGISVGSARQHYERGKTRLRALLALGGVR